MKKIAWIFITLGIVCLVPFISEKFVKLFGNLPSNFLLPLSVLGIVLLFFGIVSALFPKDELNDCPKETELDDDAKEKSRLYVAFTAWNFWKQELRIAVEKILASDEAEAFFDNLKKQTDLFGVPEFDTYDEAVEAGCPSWKGRVNFYTFVGKMFKEALIKLVSENMTPNDVSCMMAVWENKALKQDILLIDYVF